MCSHDVSAVNGCPERHDIGAYLALKSIRAVSDLLKFSRRTVQRWIHRYEQDNTVVRKFGSGRPWRQH